MSYSYILVLYNILIKKNINLVLLKSSVRARPERKTQLTSNNGTKMINVLTIMKKCTVINNIFS